MPHTRYKKRENYSYTIGVYPTIELLKNKPEQAIRVLIHTRGYGNKGVDIIKDICTKKHIEVVAADAQIHKLSNEKTYAIGIFKKFTASISQKSNHIILVNPDSHGNLGTVIRTMVGFSFRDLALIGDGADIFAPETIRASMGALFKIRFSNLSSISDYIKKFPSHQLYPFMTNGKTKLGSLTFTPPYSLLFGNEGTGLSDDYLTLGTPVYIEQSKDIDSLNIAISAGIGMYDARRNSIPDQNG